MNPQVGLYGALLEAAAPDRLTDAPCTRSDARPPLAVDAELWLVPASKARSSSSVLMLLNASGLSSNGTSTTFRPRTTRRSCGRRLRETRSGPAARSCGTGRTRDAADRRFFATARSAPFASSAACRRATSRRQERRVAGHGRDEIVLALRQVPGASRRAGRRSRRSRPGSRGSRSPRRSSRFWLALIRISSTCGAKRSMHPCHHRLAAQDLQSLVHAAHAAALAAGEDHAGDA